MASSVKAVLIAEDRMSKVINNIAKNVNSLYTSLEGNKTATRNLGKVVSGLNHVNQQAMQATASIDRMNESLGKTRARGLPDSGGGSGGVPSQPPTPSPTVPSVPSDAVPKMGLLSQYAQATEKSSIGFFRNMRYTVLNTYILIQGLKSVGRIFEGMLKKSDEQVSNLARLRLANAMINDGMQTTLELNERVFEIAQRSRGTFNDMSSFVSDMALQAGHSFNNMEEILKFSELIQKSFLASGASVESQRAGLYQLKQALASNRLQGDEFRSIIENMPQFAQMLADNLGVSRAELKQMSSEGALTADVMKKAIFESEEMINKMFDAMPKTFGSTMNHIGNIWDWEMQEVRQKMNNFLNSSFGQDVIDTVTGTLKGIANALKSLINYLPTVITYIKKFFHFAKKYQDIILLSMGIITLGKAMFSTVTAVGNMARAWLAFKQQFMMFKAIYIPIFAFLAILFLVIFVMRKMGMTWKEIAVSMIQFFKPVIVAGIFFYEVVKFIIDVIIAVGKAMWETGKVFLIVIGALIGAWIAYSIVMMMVGKTSFFAMLPLYMIIILIIAVIGVAILVVAKWGETIGTWVGFAVGAFVWLLGVVKAVFEVVLAIIAYTFGRAYYEVQHALGMMVMDFGKMAMSVDGFMTDLANGIINAFNKGIQAVNLFKKALRTIGLGKLAGSDTELIGAFGGTGFGKGAFEAGQSMMDGANAGIESMGKMMSGALEGVGTAINSFGETTAKYSEMGANIGKKASDSANKIVSKVDGLISKIRSSQLDLFQFDDSELEDMAIDRGLAGDVPTGGGSGGRGGGSGKQNIGTVDKVNEVDLSDDTMKLLRDMYERSFFQRYTQLDANFHFSYTGTTKDKEEAEQISADVEKMVVERLANLMI